MAAGDLCTLSDVKSYLSIETSGSDAYLGSLITQVSAFVCNTLQRQILSATYTDVYRGNGKERTLLRQRPITAIASVSWLGTTITTQGDLFAGTTGIATDGKSLILVNYCMPLNQPVQVVYTAGYATIPADIELAVTELVAETYTRGGHVGEMSHSTGGATTVSFSQKAMHDAIMARLKNYIAVAPLC